jgi:hypothetical protein
MTSDAPLLLTRVLIAFSLTVDGVPGGAAALTGARRRNGQKQGGPGLQSFLGVLSDRQFANFPRLDQGQRIVDF